jgi:hypothetical protein
VLTGLHSLTFCWHIRSLSTIAHATPWRCSPAAPNLCTRWRWVVRFTPWSLIPSRKKFPVPHWKGPGTGLYAVVRRKVSATVGIRTPQPFIMTAGLSQPVSKFSTVFITRLETICIFGYIWRAFMRIWEKVNDLNSCRDVLIVYVSWYTECPRRKGQYSGRSYDRSF